MENDNKRKRKALDFPIIKCAKKEVGSCLHLFLSHFPSYLSSYPRKNRDQMERCSGWERWTGLNLGKCSQFSEPVLVTEEGFPG